MKIAAISLASADKFPTKFGKYYRVLEELNGAVRVASCDISDTYTLLNDDLRFYEWKAEEWNDYCKPRNGSIV